MYFELELSDARIEDLRNSQLFRLKSSVLCFVFVKSLF